MVKYLIDLDNYSRPGIIFRVASDFESCCNFNVRCCPFGLNPGLMYVGPLRKHSKHEFVKHPMLQIIYDKFEYRSYVWKFHEFKYHAYIDMSSVSLTQFVVALLSHK